jgi:GntR family transcriptional regulator of vanillate catabolism
MSAQPDGPSSQNLAALLKLRELILSGELKGGERLSELALVERLGVSRTPIRTAMLRLEQEGLAHPIPTGGFAVTAFSERDIHAAIEVRGTLEGLAVRLAAERHQPTAELAPLNACLDALDALVLAEGVGPSTFARYVELNDRFHQLVVALADSAVLTRQITRAVALPFASANAFVTVQANLPEARTLFIVAQDQHRCIVRAIEAGEGERGEFIMREHARLARRNLDLALQCNTTRNLVPGSSLIRFQEEDRRLNSVA